MSSRASATRRAGLLGRGCLAPKPPLTSAASPGSRPPSGGAWTCTASFLGEGGGGGRSAKRARAGEPSSPGLSPSPRVCPPPPRVCPILPGSVPSSPGLSPPPWVCPRRSAVPRAQGCSRRVSSRQGSRKRLKSWCSCSRASSAEKGRRWVGGAGTPAPPRPAPPPPPGALTEAAVVKVEVPQEHAEGHGFVAGATLGLKLLGPVQQQRQLFAAQMSVPCGRGRGRGRLSSECPSEPGSHHRPPHRPPCPPPVSPPRHPRGSRCPGR